MRPWARDFKAYSLAVSERTDLETSDKSEYYHFTFSCSNWNLVLMPPDALARLSWFSFYTCLTFATAQLGLQFPMVFKISNPVNKLSASCSVLEFTAEPARVSVPFWVISIFTTFVYLCAIADGTFGSSRRRCCTFGNSYFAEREIGCF